MKRKICLTLAMLMVLSLAVGLSACKEGDKGETDSTTVTTLPAGDSGVVDDSKLYEDLPTGSYEGYEFHILNNCGVSDEKALTVMVPEDTTDTVLAAVYARNSFVKEKLNINIIETKMKYNEIKSTMQSLTSSNDFEYDIVFNETYYQTPLAQVGTYLSVDDYTDSINFDKPWWFTEAMDSIKIDGNGYELYGDFHLLYYDMIWGVTFNQQEFINNKIAFPYDMVREGNWTIAEMEKIIKITAATLGDEHYGVASHKEFIQAAISGSAFTLMYQDDEELLRPFDNEDRFVYIYTDIMNAFFASNGDKRMNWIKPDYSSAAWTSSGNFTLEKISHIDTFAGGRATFMGGVIQDIRGVRGAEFQYGIIPFPKYEAEQDTYVSHISRVASSCGIPTTSPDLDRTCVIIENLSAYSYKLIKDEYYEVVVQGRTVRDSDSIEMLDIIFGYDERGKAVFEIDDVYTLGLSDEIRKSMSDNVTEIMVNIDGAMGRVESNIETMIEAYK